MSRVYVLAGDHEQADEWIRRQNDNPSWPWATEFVNLSRPEQLRSVHCCRVVTTGTAQERADWPEFERLLKERAFTWNER